MNWIENLKIIMDDKNVNIEQLKNRIEQQGGKLSRNSISNILRGTNNPKIETIELLAKALEVELWRLFTSKDSHEDETDLNGFVEHNNEIHRIRTKQDLNKLLSILSD